MAVSAVQRIKAGVSAVLTDQQSRHEYAARLKWLIRGSGNLQAWSLEYRAGLQGRYRVDAHRSHGDATQTMTSAFDYPNHAPLSHLYEARYVYRLQDTVANTITGAALLCSTPEPAFFIRESISWPFESILSHGLDIPESKNATTTHRGPSTIFGSTSNYYHWLIEEVPMLLRAIEAEPHVQVLVHREDVNQRHRIIEQALGLSLAPTDKTVRLSEHVMPGRASDSWFVHPRDAQLLFTLGSTLAKATSGSASGPERIYLSRRNATRSLPDEQQLEMLLEKNGFTVIRPENLSWIEQINVFRGAKVIVGPHGAAFSNLVFTPPGAQVIELTNGYHYNRCFEWICHVSGHNYVPIGADDGRYPTAAQLVEPIMDAVG